MRAAFIKELRQEFPGVIYSKMRAWAFKNLYPVYGKPKQFHSGYFASETDALDYISTNRALVMSALSREVRIRSHSKREEIFNQILPQLVEYMMRFDPSRSQLSSFLFNMSANCGMSLLKKETSRTRAKKVFSLTSNEEIVARPMASDSAASPIRLPRWVRGRDRIILRELLRGRSYADIADIVARETNSKKLSRERIRQLVNELKKRINRHKK